MKKLILASLAAAALLVGAGGLTTPAKAAMQCWSGPLGLLHSCSYAGPSYYDPYYAPPPPYPYWRY